MPFGAQTMTVTAAVLCINDKLDANSTKDKLDATWETKLEISSFFVVVEENSTALEKILIRKSTLGEGKVIVNMQIIATRCS